MENLLLLHGAIGAKDQMVALAGSLQEKYIIHTLNFYGHGGLPIPDKPFSIPSFAKQVLDYLDAQKITRANIFGYSLGGYVGFYLAKYHTEKVNKLVTLATKFYWDEHVAEKEIPHLNAELILNKMPGFAEQLQKRHAPCDWKIILEKTKELLLALGKNNPLHLSDYVDIPTACLLLLGDRDKMITVEETLAVYGHLPNAQFGMLPNTPHPIEQVNNEMLSFFIKGFC